MSSRRTWATNSWACSMVSAGSFFKLELDENQKVKRDKTLRHMMIPTAPRVCLLLVQSHLAFAFFQAGFHWPSRATQMHQVALRTVVWLFPQEVFELGPGSQAAPNHEPNPRAGQLVTSSYDPQESKLFHQGALEIGRAHV